MLSARRLLRACLLAAALAAPTAAPALADPGGHVFPAALPPEAAAPSGHAFAGAEHAPTSPAHARRLAPSRFDPGPAEYPNVHRQQDVPIRMRDGTKLYADVYRPADASGQPVPGRFPAVLNQVVFNKNNGPRMHGTPVHHIGDTAVAYTPLFVRHGYVQVLVDMRGTGSSHGAWQMFGPQQQRDTYDVANWLVGQSWSNGKFAAYGPSCMAINQMFMASQRPPGLRALFPIVPMDDLYRDVLWHGGGLDAPFLAVWHGLVTSARARPGEYTASDPQSGAEMLRSRASVESLQTEMATEAYDGEYYWDRAPGRVINKIEVPTFVVGSWFGLLQRGTPRIYEALDMPPGRKQLLIGPWYHLTGGQGLGAPGTPPPLDVLALAWFDRWVKGEQNGIESYGPVTVHQLGAGRWEQYGQFPRADAGYERFYLSGERSGSAQSLNDGSLSADPPAAPGTDSMPGNSPNGACTRSTVQWSVSIVPPGQPCETDNRSHDATSLTYTTQPLEQPLHISGPLSLTLNGSTTARDATWAVTVNDVAPDGRSTQLTGGWLIQSRRALDRARTVFAPNGDPVAPFHPFTRESVLPVEPGRPNEMAIEILNTDAVIERGHRLRVTIASGEVPHVVAPPDSAANAAGGISTVHRGGASPSFLTVAVAPLGPETAAR